MALTRIKNNQLTDATIVASAKLVDNSISAGKLADDLNYGSNLTITGNLTVNGSSTTLDTVNTIIEDPILLLGKDQTGVAAYDLGFVGERGDSNNAVFIWKESADEFQAGTTTGTGDGTTVTLAGFADFQAAGMTMTTLAPSGNVTTALNASSTIAAGSSITAVTTITATGNVAGGNLTTAAAMDSATINTTGEATLASAIVSDLTSGRVVLAGTSGAIEDSANATFDGSTLGITGAITASTTVTATGNVAGGNITTAGAMEATGLITAGTTITATGNITGGNLTTAGITNSGSVTTEAVNGSAPTITATGTDSSVTLVPTGTGSVNVSSKKITSLATPTADTDAANKAYVDSIAEGLDIKASCVVATTGVLPAVTYANGASGVGATLTGDANGAFAAVDGVTLTINERIVVKDQAAALQNGIYQLSTVGDAGNPFVLTRTTDFDNGTPSGEIPGAFTFIEEGTVNEDNGFVCTTNAPVTVGTTAINWTQFSGAGQITAGDGLAKAGDVLSVNVDDVTTAIVGDAVTVKVSANLTTPNIGVANGDSFTATGTVSGATITDGTATIISGAIASVTTITASGNLTTGAGNIAGGNITTAIMAATGAVSGLTLTSTSGITISANDIDSSGAAITVNQAAADLDFVVEGGTDANLFRTDAGSDTVLVATATATTGATLKVAGTDSVLIPVGTSAQRPGTPATGMIRLNTTLDSFEFYDSNSWTTAGADFTVIATETFNGDNSTVAFTLSSSQTTASCIVSINGVVQLPTTAYAVSTTTLTFTEAPLAGDVIEVREITTTSTITYLSNAQQTASIETLDGAATVEIVGDVLPKVNNSQDLGSASKLWAEVRATTYYGDGSNLTGLAAGDNVTNGTSNVSVASNADITLTRGGTLTATVGTAGITMNNGAFVGDLTGTADAATLAADATKLATARAIALTGDVTGTANFDGSVGISIAATIAANSVALGTDTTGNYVAAGAVAGTGLTGGASGEGATFTVTSNATSANTANAIVARDGTGNFTAGVITATATAARYADLAEKYASDGDIEAGTVVHFAGEGKVAECDIANCRSVAGIVSTDPAYLMNSDADGVALAIAGRVPTKVTGVVNAGDLIVSAGNGRGMANNDAAIGTVIGKAIEANEGGDGVIEVLALMM